MSLLAPCGALWEPLGSIFGSVGRLVAHLAAFWATFDASGVAFSGFCLDFGVLGCFFLVFLLVLDRGLVTFYYFGWFS